MEREPCYCYRPYSYQFTSIIREQGISGTISGPQYGPEYVNRFDCTSTPKYHH